MDFSARLVAERRRLGFRAADWAERHGITANTQSLYENGKRAPDADYLQRSCELGADPSFLLTGRRLGEWSNSAVEHPEFADAWSVLPQDVRDSVRDLVRTMARSLGAS